MPRDLFGSGTTPVALSRAFNRYTVVGSALLHMAIIAVVLIVPLFASDMLPKPVLGRVQFVSDAFVAPTPPPPAPAVVRVSTVNPNAAPIVPPSEIRPEDPPVPSNLADGGLTIAGANASSSPGINIGDSMGNATPAPPPATVVRQAPPTGPVHVGGLIHPPIKTNNVLPIYPAIAQAARVEGDVHIEAIIGTDGVVQQTRVLSGIPLLNDAALSAVKQWRYTPTTLNNQPVAVIMTVTVSFRLQH